jgi:hypothetical protein
VVHVRDAEAPGERLKLTREELHGLGEVCRDWARRRDAWWTFGWRGHWTDSGRYHFLVEPGGRDRVQVMEAWKGSAATVPLAAPEALAGGAGTRVADLVQDAPAILSAPHCRLAAIAPR